MFRKFFLSFLILSFMSILVSLLSPIIGLGFKDNYFFYKYFDISRNEQFKLSIIVFFISTIGLFNSQLKNFGSNYLLNTKTRSAIEDIKNFILQALVIKSNEIYLLFFGLISQLLYFVYIPILFECDAASYYNSAKELLPFLEGSYNFDRGPFYPIYLILTGSIFPGTLIINLIIQFILGVVSGVVFYRMSILFCSKNIAFVASIIFIISGLSLFGAKQILPYQFFIFFFMVSMLFLIKVLKSFEKKDIYAFYFFVTFCLFVRWELQILLILGTIFMYVFAPKKIYGIITYSCLSSFLLIFFYTFLKFIATGNSEHIGRIHMHSGSQIFWNVYSAAYPVKNNFGDVRNISLVSKNNGPNTQKLYDIILEVIEKDYKVVESEKVWLSEEKVYNSQSLDPLEKSAYFQLYEKFGKDTVSLVNSMFHVGDYYKINEGNNGFYTPFIVRHLKSQIGPREAQKLLWKVSYEAIINNLNIYLKRRIFNFFSFANFDLYSKSFYGFSTEYVTISQPFNLGNCAKSLLPSLAMKEYTFERKIYENLPFLDNFKKISSQKRNYYRTFFGLTFFLITIIFLFLKNHNKKILFCLITYNLAHMSLLTLLAGGAFTKYEVIVMIMKILIFFCFISGFREIKKNYK